MLANDVKYLGHSESEDEIKEELDISHPVRLST
jgi:hypothetical protein